MSVRVIEGKNRATPEEAASFVDKFMEFEKEIDAEKSAFMLRCKAIRAKQKEVCDDAKSQGVPKQHVKGNAKIKRKLAEIKDIEDEIEDDREYFVDIRVALHAYADTPLGAAAVAAEKMKGGVDPAAAAAEKAWRDADPAKGKKAPEKAH